MLSLITEVFTFNKITVGFHIAGDGWNRTNSKSQQKNNNKVVGDSPVKSDRTIKVLAQTFGMNGKLQVLRTFVSICD